MIAALYCFNLYKYIHRLFFFFSSPFFGGCYFFYTGLYLRRYNTISHSLSCSYACRRRLKPMEVPRAEMLHRDNTALQSSGYQLNFFLWKCSNIWCKKSGQQVWFPFLTSFYSRLLILRVLCTQPIAVNSSRQIHTGKAEQSYRPDFKSKEKNIY